MKNLESLSEFDLYAITPKGSIWRTKSNSYKLKSIIDSESCYIPLLKYAKFKNSIFLLFMTEFLAIEGRNKRRKNKSFDYDYDYTEVVV